MDCREPTDRSSQPAVTMLEILAPSYVLDGGVRLEEGLRSEKPKPIGFGFSSRIFLW